MKKFNSLDVAALLVWLLPPVYLLYIWPSLPASVPVHYGINGAPDRYGSKNEFLTSQFLLMGVSLGIYLLLKFLPAIDPKKYVKYGEPTFQKLALGLVIFLSALSILIAYSAIIHGFKAGKMILPVVGLLFAFIGNIMYNIKPNYFAGVRTPWTLEDPENWKSTHRLAGKLWFIGGLVITVAVLLLPNKAGFVTFMSLMVVLVLVPVVYSFVYFKKHQPK
ncbi:MAG TPA: SdpI family protein [Mucilaginibacter sp.]|nr:SdpI family protein [Mucilaginibacter sp.]